MAATEAARNQLAQLQRSSSSAGGGKSRKGKDVNAKPLLPGAESASLRSSSNSGALTPNPPSSAAKPNTGQNAASSPPATRPSFYYYGLDSACDQVQTRRQELGAGDFSRRPRTKARARPAAPRPGGANVSWRFDCLDAAHQGLPSGADLVATHDTLEHLPIESAFMFLSAVKASGARWLLIGGFANGTAPNREPRPGVSGFYALDPSLPPFNLRPEPVELLYEDEEPAGAGGGEGGSGGSPTGGGSGAIKGRSEVELQEMKSAGRQVVRLYNATAMSWDDGMFDLFNYSRPPAQPPSSRAPGAAAKGGPASPERQQQRGAGQKGGAVGGVRPGAAAATAAAAGGGSERRERMVPTVKLPKLVRAAAAVVAGGMQAGGGKS